MCTYFSERVGKKKKVQSTNVADRKQATLPSRGTNRRPERGRWMINIQTGVPLLCHTTLEVLKCHAEKRGGEKKLCLENGNVNFRQPQSANGRGPTQPLSLFHRRHFLADLQHLNSPLRTSPTPNEHRNNRPPLLLSPELGSVSL